MSTHQHQHEEHEQHDDHAHGHSHGHGGHGHHHHGAPQAGQGRTFALAVGLNVLIVIVQAVYGFLAHSTALLADAGHNLSDVLGLLLAWGAVWLGKRQPSSRYTFGLGSSSILASLANAALLLFACGAIVLESIQRLLNPAPVAGLDVFVVATLGMIVNGFSAWLFMRGSQEDLNVRGAFLHMAADAAISAAVAVSGLIILFTGASWLDPLMSLIVVSVIVYGTWGLGRDAMRLAMAAVPPSVDMPRVERYLEQLPGVRDVHDLHVWALSTTENALTVHLVMPEGHPGDAFVQGVVTTLRQEYSMHHATVQVEFGEACRACVLNERGHAH
ncbi:cation transporter [Caballeronia novacaledonica]|uniref:Cation transporter n=1 Tax=Caballeronia novacaledonica TaxID=1544861 RepID=A0A2U3I6V6_9BURK|nr:cation diffusion facilitator family transporter [Caballeronia novacaledonica]SPB15903.1 cation transporter [Caballeronia novacaledonica]